MKSYFMYACQQCVTTCYTANWSVREQTGSTFIFTVHIAVAHCRTKPYVYGLVYRPVLDV